VPNDHWFIPLSPRARPFILQQPAFDGKVCRIPVLGLAFLRILVSLTMARSTTLPPSFSS